MGWEVRALGEGFGVTRGTSIHRRCPNGGAWSVTPPATSEGHPLKTNLLRGDLVQRVVSNRM